MQTIYLWQVAGDRYIHVTKLLAQGGTKHGRLYINKDNINSTLTPQKRRAYASTESLQHVKALMTTGRGMRGWFGSLLRLYFDG